LNFGFHILRKPSVQMTNGKVRMIVEWKSGGRPPQSKTLARLAAHSFGAKCLGPRQTFGAFAF
jgi:hypothetical protein